MVKVILLGTGSAEGVPAHGCYCPTCSEARLRRELWRQQFCIAIELKGHEVLVVDVGSPHHVNTLSDYTIRAVLLTHLHGDHVLGLYSLRWSQQEDGVKVFYPRECPDEAGVFRNPVSLKPREVNAWAWIELGGVKARGIPLSHVVPTLGYEVLVSGRRIMILADTKGLRREVADRLLAGREQVDLLVVDATFPPGYEHPAHNNVDDALRIADLLKPRVTCLAHISHVNMPFSALRDYVSTRENVVIGLDGMEIDV